jgi:parafibromin
VVGVFCDGKEWQFKHWKLPTPSGGATNKPVEIFSRCLGVFVHYDDQIVPPEVKAWNVKIYRVRRGRRRRMTTTIMMMVMMMMMMMTIGW